ncbi:hypothetical protein [Amycolatopsis pithecellobii]|uniref:Uncharacterized protein n=1 Tax=Amycolatopsis pithecellobii TaxID=664692 RepID=A0A6N7Z5A4_9PSEU|nr:hypothetical protein [Amycolatopsis pithecellobii]MTD55831.1 hypothetical protein [Amycolatopsis pithecellobii]
MTGRGSLARRVTALFGALAVASLAAYGIFAASTPPDPTQFSFFSVASDRPFGVN